MMRARRIGFVALLAIAVAACTTPPPAAIAEAPSEQSQASPTVTADTKTTEIHPGAGGSPHVRSEWVVDGANLSITYGRPYLKGRIVGETVEPRTGQVWRLGADEATTISSNRPLTIGGTRVPAGDHTLWVLATGNAWQLIVNEETGQAGTDYDAARDLARIPMTVNEVGALTEQLTITIRNGQLVIEWGRMVATVPLRGTEA